MKSELDIELLKKMDTVKVLLLEYFTFWIGSLGAINYFHENFWPPLYACMVISSGIGFILTTITALTYFTSNTDTRLKILELAQSVLYFKNALFLCACGFLILLWSKMVIPPSSASAGSEQANWSGVAHVRILIGGNIRVDGTSEFLWYRAESFVILTLFLFTILFVLLSLTRMNVGKSSLQSQFFQFFSTLMQLAFGIQMALERIFKEICPPLCEKEDLTPIPTDTSSTGSVANISASMVNLLVDCLIILALGILFSLPQFIDSVVFSRTLFVIVTLSVLVFIELFETWMSQNTNVTTVNIFLAATTMLFAFYDIYLFTFQKNSKKKAPTEQQKPTNPSDPPMKKALWMKMTTGNQQPFSVQAIKYTKTSKKRE